MFESMRMDSDRRNTMRVGSIKHLAVVLESSCGHEVRYRQHAVNPSGLHPGVTLSEL